MRIALFLLSILPPAVAMSAQEIHAQNPWDREMAAGLVVDQEMIAEDLLSGTSICEAPVSSITSIALSGRYRSVMY